MTDSHSLNGGGHRDGHRLRPACGILEAFLETRYWLAVASVILMTALLNGLGTVPREPYLLAAQDPFHRVSVHPENYFQRSPLLPLVAYALGLTSPTTFNGFTLAIAVTGQLVFAYFARKQLGPLRGFTLAALVLAHPVTTILFSWLGTPDPISFLISVLVLFATSPIQFALLGALGGFNHPVMVFAMPMILLLRRSAAEETIDREDIMGAGIGLGIGVACTAIFLNLNHIEAYSRWEFLFDRDLSTWVKHNLALFHYAIYSLHQSVWIAIAIGVLALPRTRMRVLVAFGLTQATSYLITFFSMDTTRVFALLAWAPAAYFLRSSMLVGVGSRMSSSDSDRTLVCGLLAIALLGLLIPSYYVWGGELHMVPFDGFYRSIFSRLFSQG